MQFAVAQRIDEKLIGFGDALPRPAVLEVTLIGDTVAGGDRPAHAVDLDVSSNAGLRDAVLEAEVLDIPVEERAQVLDDEPHPARDDRIHKRTCLSLDVAVVAKISRRSKGRFGPPTTQFWMRRIGPAVGECAVRWIAGTRRDHAGLQARSSARTPSRPSASVAPTLNAMLSQSAPSIGIMPPFRDATLRWSRRRSTSASGVMLGATTRNAARMSAPGASENATSNCRWRRNPGMMLPWISAASSGESLPGDKARAPGLRRGDRGRQRRARPVPAAGGYRGTPPGTGFQARRPWQRSAAGG